VYQINDIKEGCMLEGFPVLVHDRKEGTTKTGSSFLDLTLRDKTGEIKAKLWNYASGSDPVKSGITVKVWGAVTAYQGTLQIVINKIVAADLPIEGFLKSSRFSIDKMWGIVSAIPDSFVEPMTRHVTKELLNLHKDLFKTAPAASGVHNAWVGGLLEHVWSLTVLAENVVKHYRAAYQPKLSRDKILFGVLIHDIGKVVEYGVNKYTPLGCLTPHIVLGPAWVYEICNKFFMSQDVSLTIEEFEIERAHLMHILASHHGKLEWGSPVVPSSLEAVLVHQLDMIDSRFMHAMEKVEGKDGDIPGFSEKSYIEKCSFLKYNHEAV